MLKHKLQTFQNHQGSEVSSAFHSLIDRFMGAIHLQFEMEASKMLPGFFDSPLILCYLRKLIAKFFYSCFCDERKGDTLR